MKLLHYYSCCEVIRIWTCSSFGAEHMGKQAAFVFLMAVLCAWATQAQANQDDGTNVYICYTNTFEDYNINDAITNEPGWQLSGPHQEALTTNTTDLTEGSPYVMGATHTSHLHIIGALTNTFVKDDTKHYVYIDMMIRGTPNIEPPALGPEPHAAAYINTNRNFVFRHSVYWDPPGADPEDYYPMWNTNSDLMIPTGTWVRLTFKIDFLTDTSYKDAYYQLYVNPGPDYNTQVAAHSNDWAYNAPVSAWYPEGGTATWFMCANDDAGGSPEWLRSIEIIGDTHIDDYVVTDDGPPPAWPPFAYTSNDTPVAWMLLNNLISNGWSAAQIDAADNADTDGDGSTANQEYDASTQPTNALSLFRLENVAAAGDDWKIVWQGNSDTTWHNYAYYTIYRATNIVTPNWVAKFDYPRTNAAGGLCEWTDPDGTNVFPKMFYKVTAPTNTL